jgi:hypothetical protein
MVPPNGGQAEGFADRERAALSGKFAGFFT